GRPARPRSQPPLHPGPRPHRRRAAAPHRAAAAARIGPGGRMSAAATIDAPARATSMPPGPTGPLWTLGFLLWPDRFLDACYRRYGDFFTVRVPGRTIAIVADPEANRRIFTGDPDVLHAGEGNVILAPLLGTQSVLLLDGDAHMRQRKLILPAFHGER